MPGYRITGRSISIAAALLLLGALIPNGRNLADSAILFVSPAGDDSTDCLTPGTACKTIAGGIAKSAAGDTIRIAEGIYQGTGQAVADIYWDLTLSGGWDSAFLSQSGYSVIDGSAAGSAIKGVYIHRPMSVSITRFEIRGFPSERGDILHEPTGIANEGYLTVDNVWIHDNHAPTHGGGISSMDSNGPSTLTILNSRIQSNTSGRDGGGIYAAGTTTISIEGSDISGNRAGSRGGGMWIGFSTLYMADTLVHDNTVADYLASSLLHHGGGIDFYSSYFTIEESEIYNNHVHGNGGGIYNGNAPTGGSSDPVIRNSAIYQNFADLDGGGIYQKALNLVIENTSVSGNDADENAGGVFIGQSNVLNLYNTTLSHNSGVISGGGLVNDRGAVTGRNSLIGGNTSAASPDCKGTLLSSGYNLIGNDEGCVFTAGTGDQVDADPRLQDLSAWIGFDALLSTSPAINAGDPSGCVDRSGAPIIVDQRGHPRDEHCDIGAIEYSEPGVPVRMIPLGGDLQAVQGGTEFPDVFGVMLVDGENNPVAGRDILFSAPVAGPGGIFLVSGTNEEHVITDAAGMSHSSRLLSNPASGRFAVTASDALAGVHTTFALRTWMPGKVFMPVMKCQFCTDYLDNFNSPPYRWYIGEDEDVWSRYEGGEYQIGTKNGEYVYMYNSPSCLMENYYTAVTMHWAGTEGEGLGLMFELSGDYESYHLFMIDTRTQTFTWLYFSDGFWVYRDRISAASIRSGTASNSLEITRYAPASSVFGTVIVKINGTVVVNEDFPTSGPVKTGLVVLPGTSTPIVVAHFDDFVFQYASRTAGAGWIGDPFRVAESVERKPLDRALSPSYR